MALQVAIVGDLSHSRVGDLVPALKTSGAEVTLGTLLRSKEMIPSGLVVLEPLILMKLFLRWMSYTCACS